MPRNSGRAVKDARARLENAEQAARAGGISESELANEAAVRAASDLLTEAKTFEHLRLIQARLHAIRKRKENEQAE